MPKPRPDAALEELLTPVAAEHGVEIDAVVVAQQYGSTVVRVIVEEPEGEAALDSDTLADVSRAISRAMDETDPIEGEYLLEVSTPGIDRPLLKAAHWRRQLGRTVDLRLRDGQRLSGRVLEADEVAATLDVDGQATTIEYDRVKKARARVEFTADADTEE